MWFPVSCLAALKEYVKGSSEHHHKVESNSRQFIAEKSSGLKCALSYSTGFGGTVMKRDDSSDDESDDEETAQEILLRAQAGISFPLLSKLLFKKGRAFVGQLNYSPAYQADLRSKILVW